MIGDDRQPLTLSGMLTEPEVAGVVLALLVLSAGTSDRTGRLGALALLALSVLWLRVNGGMEGAILVSFTEDHGLTAADLAGFAGGAIALWRLATRLRAPLR